MYTHEIIETIKNSNGVITKEQYIDMCLNSPQIIQVYVDPDNRAKFNYFAMQCDDYDGEIKFRVENNFNN